jgi:hypothetical protein
VFDPSFLVFDELKPFGLIHPTLIELIVHPSEISISVVGFRDAITIREQTNRVIRLPTGGARDRFSEPLV